MKKFLALFTLLVFMMAMTMTAKAAVWPPGNSKTELILHQTDVVISNFVPAEEIKVKKESWMAATTPVRVTRKVVTYRWQYRVVKDAVFHLPEKNE